MSGWKLCFVLLLYLQVCFNIEVYEYKTIGRGPDVTPICTNTTEQVIMLIVCKIRTYRIGGECRLLYRYGGDFEHECDSRFTLKMENQTVFLHLTGLTPVDSGNHTCECSSHGETRTLHLNITVEDVSEEGERESDVTSHTWVLNALIAATTVISITAVILGLIYREQRHRRQTAPLRNPQNTEPEAIEPYSTFMRRDSVLYSTVGPHNCPNNRNQSNTSTTQDTRPEALL